MARVSKKPFDKVFSERLSSVARREQLEQALEFCREGDVLIVTKLDRLARSMADLVSITSRLKSNGIELRILAMQLDTGTPTGKLMLNMMGSFAEFEREIMLERQREGVAKAKAAGKYKGRVPTARRQSAEVVKLRREGMKPEQIATQLGISRASVFRVLHENRGAGISRLSVTGEPGTSCFLPVDRTAHHLCSISRAGTSKRAPDKRGHRAGG